MVMMRVGVPRFLTSVVCVLRAGRVKMHTARDYILYLHVRGRITGHKGVIFIDRKQHDIYYIYSSVAYNAYTFFALHDILYGRLC